MARLAKSVDTLRKSIETRSLNFRPIRRVGKVMKKTGKIIAAAALAAALTNVGPADVNAPPFFATSNG